MKDWALAQEHLGALDSLRLEWSLQLNPQGAFPRKKPLFWMGYEGDPKNTSTYAALADLIEALEAPEEIRSLQLQLAKTAKCQGIRLDLEPAGAPTYCLYSNHAPTGLKPAEIRAYQWQKCKLVKQAVYSPVYFKEGLAIEDLALQVHPVLRESFKACCENERLIDRSAYLQQFSEGSLQETYLAYYWHPTLALVAHTLPEFMEQSLEESPYLNLPFRYMGFSTNADAIPEVTFYFSAPKRGGGWPADFSELQSAVTASSKILVEEIAMMAKQLEGAN